MYSFIHEERQTFCFGRFVGIRSFMKHEKHFFLRFCWYSFIHEERETFFLRFCGYSFIHEERETFLFLRFCGYSFIHEERETFFGDVLWILETFFGGGFVGIQFDVFFFVTQSNSDKFLQQITTNQSEPIHSLWE